MKKIFGRHGYEEVPSAPKKAANPFADRKPSPESSKAANIHVASKHANSALQNTKVSAETEMLMGLIITSFESTVIRMEKMEQRLLKIEEQTGTISVRVDKIAEEQALTRKKLDTMHLNRTLQTSLPPIVMPPSVHSDAESDEDEDAFKKIKSARGQRKLSEALIEGESPELQVKRQNSFSKFFKSNQNPDKSENEVKRSRAGSSRMQRPKTARGGEKHKEHE